MNISESFVLLGYYILWILVIVSPLVIGITIYYFVKKKGTQRSRRLLGIASLILFLLAAFQVAGSAYRKKRVEEMPQETIYN